MIVSVCSAKGAPGVTDFTTALGMVWPGRRALLEADTSGSDLTFRMRLRNDGRTLAPSPSLLSVASQTRGSLSDGLLPFTQPSTLGVPVVPGALTAEMFAPMARLWPQAASALASWDGTVVADLGRLQPGNPAAALAQQSAAVVVMTRTDLAGLYHLRERVGELTALVGRPEQERSPVVVVVRPQPGTAARAAVQQVQQVLAAAGSPVPVVGAVPDDPKAVAMLREGVLTRRLLGSELVRSAQAVTQALLGWWPYLDVPVEEHAVLTEVGPRTTSRPGLRRRQPAEKTTVNQGAS